MTGVDKPDDNINEITDSSNNNTNNDINNNDNDADDDDHDDDHDEDEDDEEEDDPRTFIKVELIHDILHEAWQDAILLKKQNTNSSNKDTTIVPSPFLVGSIDQGTSSSRFLLFTKHGRIVASAQKEHTQIFPVGEDKV
jgi:chromatin remodeling complex protein RSC6